MADIKAVEKPAEDPKAGKPRSTSETKFPYYDLENAVAVTKAIYEQAGGQCDQVQLAALLGNKGVRSGAFLSRVGAAKMFGVIEQTNNRKFRVSARGQAIVAPVTETSATQAKMEAFFAVELFKGVFDQFHGMTLPQEAGLRNLFETSYGVVSSRVIPTVKIMLDSAEQAALFNASGDRTRMVLPLGGSTATVQPKSPGSQKHAVDSPAPIERHGGGRGSGDGNGSGDQSIDPMVLAFVRKLPPAGSTLNSKATKALVDAFTAMVMFIYAHEDMD